MRERSWRQMQGLTWPPPGPSSWLYILGLTPPQLRKRGWAGERILMLPHLPVFLEASQVALVGKNLPANIGDIIDVSSIPGSGRSPGGGHSNPLQYSCLKNPMDREAWWATVHSIAKSRIRQKGLSTRAQTFIEWTVCYMAGKSSKVDPLYSNADGYQKYIVE